jgi:hypothetical protein
MLNIVKGSRPAVFWRRGTAETKNKGTLVVCRLHTAVCLGLYRSG